MSGVSVDDRWSDRGSQASYAPRGRVSSRAWAVGADRGGGSPAPLLRPPPPPSPFPHLRKWRAPHPCGAHPSASEAPAESEGFPPSPGLAAFLTSSKPPSSLRKAPRRGAERKHAAGVRNEDHVWGRRPQSAAAGGGRRGPPRGRGSGGSSQCLRSALGTRRRGERRRSGGAGLVAGGRAGEGGLPRRGGRGRGRSRGFLGRSCDRGRKSRSCSAAAARVRRARKLRINKGRRRGRGAAERSLAAVE